MRRAQGISAIRPTGKRSRRAVAAIALTALSIGVSSSLISAADDQTINQAPPYEPLRAAVRSSPPTSTTAPAPPSTTIAPTKVSSGSTLPKMVQQILDMTNAERAKVGVAPLTYHPKLEEAAEIHANDQRNQPCQIGYLTHTGSDGSNAADRIARTGLRINNWGENIACGFSGVDAVMNGWMNSSGHRRNILNPNLTHLGISIMTSDSGIYYWVQNFGLPRN